MSQPTLPLKDKLSKVIQQLFNDDRNMYDYLKPSKREIENLEKFEHKVLIDNGLKNINGGYSIVTVYDGDEETLLLNIECGEYDIGGGGNKSYWRAEYNRKTEKFEQRL